jgi:hypothetical protein
MMITVDYPGDNAERVPGHRWVFANARTISGSFASAEKLIPYFSSNDVFTPFMYTSMLDHHDFTLFIVLSSQHTPASSSLFIMLSIVSAQCRLYGTILSGSSWWIVLQPPHFNRCIFNVCISPSVMMTFRFRQPFGFISSQPQTGQTIFSSALT